MLMTKQEAAEKWCPMSRVGPAAWNMNESGEFPPSCLCIADQCAMWRWKEYRKVTGQRTCTATELGLEENGLGEKMLLDVFRDVPHRGYCGMAGVPLYPVTV